VYFIATCRVEWKRVETPSCGRTHFRRKKILHLLTNYTRAQRERSSLTRIKLDYTRGIKVFQFNYTMQTAVTKDRTREGLHDDDIKTSSFNSILLQQILFRFKMLHSVCVCERHVEIVSL
jgi:hypothetical protein